MTRRSDRHTPPSWGWLIVTILLASGMLAFAQGGPGARSRPSSPAETDTGKLAQEMPPTLREGTKLIGLAGTFRNTGDRIEFRPNESDQRLVVLENLALERVASVLAEVPRQRLWTVSGTVTEFRGVNFLLVTRALLKSNRSPAADSP